MKSDFWGEVCLLIAVGFFLIVGFGLEYLGCSMLWNCYEREADNLLKISLFSLLVVFSPMIGFFAGLPWYLLARKLLKV